VLTALVEAHEEKHFLMEMPRPIEAIRFGLEPQRFRPLVLTT
jgi:antitoxin component HigA of HigAB toxin-antitoxin module